MERKANNDLQLQKDLTEPYIVNKYHKYNNLPQTHKHINNRDSRKDYTKSDCKHKGNDVILFHDVFGLNLKTHIYKTFNNLFNKHFLNSYKYHKIINQHASKISYVKSQKLQLHIRKLNNKKLFKYKKHPKMTQHPM